MTSISEILTRHGSDKNLPHTHAYGPLYDSLFPNRLAVRNVLEIGVERGYSLLAWREAFPMATIVGLDHNDCSECPRLDGLEIHRGSQCYRDTVLGCVRGREFDLIIDDASHRLADQLRCLWWLWPHLKSGGRYVVEEMDIQDGVGPGNNLASISLLGNARWWQCPGPIDGLEYLLIVTK